MSRTSTLILLGILTMLTPFSGLPNTYRSVLIVAFGVAILGIGLSLRSEETQRVHADVQVPEPAAPEEPIVPTISPI